MPRTEENDRPLESPPGLPATAARIGAQCAVEGAITAGEDLLIQGRFKGRIELPGRVLIIDVGAEVEADISAGQVFLNGRLKGNVAAGGRVVLSPSARMTGDISAAGVSIKDGAQFKGTVKMERSGA